jgi:hypothetical protein
MPIDPGAAQRQLTEAPGEPAADSGTSFADLLAAMLAPGAPAGQLQPPVAEEAVFERLDAAEMFNETGLFRGAAPLPALGAAPGDAAASPAVPVATVAVRLNSDLQALPPGLDPAAHAAGVPASAAGLAGTASGPVSGAAVAGAKAAQGATPSIHGQPVAVSATPAQAAAAGPEAAGPGAGRVSPRTATALAQLLAARTGAAAAQVSVHAVEGGISVMARVDKLSREERDRLRAEIGELLALHGYAGADIILNGEAWPLPQRENF